MTQLAQDHDPAGAAGAADACKVRSTCGEAHHGGLDLKVLARYGVRADQAVDFSSNILLHGPSPQVQFAVRNANLARYPDRDCNELRQAIATHFNIAPQRILVGNGCSELIHLVAGALLEPGDHALIVGPTFSEYHRASQLASANIVECLATTADDFTVPVDDIAFTLARRKVKLVWICNPNNPTGKTISEHQLLQWVRQYPATTFVVDESYIEFAERATSVIERCEANLIVLRSMTKCFGIAGLRLGFAVTSPELYQRLRGRRIPWTINAPAQAAGVAALRDEAYYATALAETRHLKRAFFTDLVARGFHPLQSDANFFLLPIANASEVRQQLMAEGLVVRSCHSFGLAEYLRVAVLDSGSNQRLATALSRLCRQEPSVESLASGQGLDPACNSSAPASFSHSRASVWDNHFRELLGGLFRMRRDVRNFRTDSISPESLRRWIEIACLAPSVGLCQPWKFVTVADPARRALVAREFETQNRLASGDYESDTAAEYRKLKLAGLREAPEHLAVFVDPDPDQGRGLGRKTMPESVAYSVVAAIQNFWLAARSEGVGVGWVSILRPEAVNTMLEVPAHWRLIAYLCVGYPQQVEVNTPELESLGWETRGRLEEQWYRR